MEQRVFKSSPVKRILYNLLGLIVVFVFTTIFFADDGSKIYYRAINIIAFAVCFLIIFFEKDVIVICDEVGCTVKKKIFWKNSGESYGFKWNEVSETEYVADAESSREFYLEIDGVKRQILTANFSLDDFDYFIETVNEATPHLPYVWERGSGLVSSTFEGRRYRKIAR